MNKETTAKVLYSKDINKKNNKKWIDGIGTFISTSSANRYRFILRDLEGKKFDDTYYKPPNMDGLLPEISEENRIGKFLIIIDSFISKEDDSNENQTLETGDNSDFITEVKATNNNFVNRNESINLNIDTSNSTTKQFPARHMKKIGISRKGIRPLNIYSTPQPKPENTESSSISFSSSFNQNDGIKRNSFVPPRQISNPNPNSFTIPTPSEPSNGSNSSPKYSKSSKSRKLRDVPRTFDEIIEFFAIYEDNFKEEVEDRIPDEIITASETTIRPETIEIPDTTETVTIATTMPSFETFKPIEPENQRIPPENDIKQNPTNVLAAALSSEDESISQIIKNNMDDSDDDDDQNSFTKGSGTTGTDEQDSIVSSEASSLVGNELRSSVIQQPFKPPTPINPEPSININPNLSECLKQEIGLLWGSKLKSIGKRPPKIPTNFESIDEYKHYFIQGIVFEMNSKILDVYSLYQAALFTACNKTPMCKAHSTKMAFYINSYNGSYYYACTKPGCKNKQSVPPDAMMVDLEENEDGDGCKISSKVRNKLAIESFMKKKHIAYHESRMFRTKENQIYLMFNTDKDENIEYTKDDVWVIFSERLKPFFAISESYGVYSNTKIEIGPFFNDCLSSIPQQLRVTAIRVFNAQSERQAIINLLTLTEEQMPIIPILLAGGTFPSYLSTPEPMTMIRQIQIENDQSNSQDGDYIDPSYKSEEQPSSLQEEKMNPEADIQRIATDICDKFSLNEDQRAALFKVADFFKDENEPMLLVQGLFGAGKSKLLSVIAIFLDTVLTLLGRTDKILVAASTNVAVDNVLSNLFEFEHTNFTRVGSVKKIRRSLLPFVTGHGTEESISELSSIIHETLQSTGRKRGRSRRLKNEDENEEEDLAEIGSKRLSAEAEKRIVQEALRNAEDEMNKKVCKIDTCRIVGVTCAACSFAVMTGRVFPFVLLDECSQQTEPISLIPMSFGCRNLICCGDPKQLPPTLVREASEGYGRPLFTRMMTMIQPIMLSIQYRCHPRIADICSYAFYNGKVKNGVTEDDRAPLFQMPTLCVFNVICGEESMKGGSIYNTAEAITVINLVKYLIDIGITPEEIGVIAFYKAQVEQIALPLSEGRRHPIVDVSTVDAFQGDEREVIIISTAKTKQSSFVDSPNRINVAISRAKRHLFIVTRVSSLMKLEKWNFVINRAGNKPNISINLSNAPPTKWLPFG